MDWKEMLNQCLCPVYYRIEKEESLPYGSVFFNPGDRETLARQLEDTKVRMERPGFLVGDMEMGAGEVVQGEVEFPSMRAAGICGDFHLAYQAGQSAAAAGQRAGGLNWTLAPCVDICACRTSPMVSIRSAGEDVETVIATAGSYIRGVQAGGCLATAKHFPGDGYSRLDQHLTTVVNPLSKEDWWSGPGRVYRELIKAGVAAVMPGHIALPAFDEVDSATGLYRPATLSRNLITGLLREELGFEGLVVSDALEMAGMIGYMNYFDACEAFLNAGGDVLLFALPDERFYREMELRLRRGTLTEETLFQAASRVLEAKERQGLLSSGGGDSAEPRISRDEEVAAATAMAEKAVVVARDRYRQLPIGLPRKSRVLHLVLEQGPGSRKDYFDSLTSALGERFDSVEQWVDPGCEATSQAIRRGRFDLVVCSIACLPSFGTGVIRLQGPIARNLMNGWMRMGVPVVFISHGDPCVHQDYESLMDMVINTYGICHYGIDRLLQVTFGEPAEN